jgi:hypothetical protein
MPERNTADPVDRDYIRAVKRHALVMSDDQIRQAREMRDAANREMNRVGPGLMAEIKAMHEEQLLPLGEIRRARELREQELAMLPDLSEEERPKTSGKLTITGTDDRGRRVRTTIEEI